MRKLDIYINQVRTMQSKYIIVLLCNVEGLTNTYEDYDEDSLEGDYYSLQAFQSIRDTIHNLGFDVISYFNELDFINYFLNTKLEFSNYLVISTAKTGTYLGRKSLIPAFCELNGLKYLGCDPYAVSFAKDKFHWHILLEKANISIPNYWLFNFHNGWFANQKPRNNYKIICKLNNESCGVGLSNKNIVCYNKDIDGFLDNLSRKYYQSVLVEQFITGYEVEVPVLVLRNEIISFEPCIINIDDSILLKDKILDYNIRKNDEYRYELLKDYDNIMTSNLKKTAADIARLLNFKGISRIDFRIDTNKNYYVTDVATTPFFNQNSSVRMGIEAMGYTYEDFISMLIYSIID